MSQLVRRDLEGGDKRLQHLCAHFVERSRQKLDALLAAVHRQYRQPLERHLHVLDDLKDRLVDAESAQVLDRR